MSSIMNDERVRWIRQRVVLSLELQAEAFDEYFTDSLERARSAGLARGQLEEFLSNKHGAGSALFFASQKWTEAIEVEEELEVPIEEGEEGGDRLRGRGARRGP
jgi:hypothetical protein